MKNLSILGSTGSIGTQALEVVRNSNELRVVALSTNVNITKLYEQIVEFKPKLVAVYDEKKALDLERLIKNLEVRPLVLTGMNGLIEVSRINEADIVLTAIVGMVGIRPTLAAIEARKDVALANKESLVCAGNIIMRLAKEKNVKILPVDSEHSAIFQCLDSFNLNKPKKLLLTASGGPFLKTPVKELSKVGVQDAISHPNWSMGKKISVDSSTMVNKGLEVIEARWLFDITSDNIEVLVHPQSIVHSAVEFQDGSVIAQMGLADMKIPISYALNYPLRMKISDNSLDLFKISKLEFIKPDFEKFRGLRLAFEAIKIGKSLPIVYNIANEVAVDLFLKEQIPYLEIVKIIEESLENHHPVEVKDIDIIEEIERDVSTKIRKKYI